jgi:dihydrofolate reductase
LNGTLPWSLPAELQHFKETTHGGAILMGRKTFDGMGKRALPGRTTIVMTRDASAYDAENDKVLVMETREQVLDWYKSQADHKDLFIIGGGEMFVLFEQDIELLYQTVVDAEVEADTHFPEDFDMGRYALLSSEHHAKDEANPYDFTIKTWKKY